MAYQKKGSIKVTFEDGSEHDFTSIAACAGLDPKEVVEVDEVEDALSFTSTMPVQNKVIATALSNKADLVNGKIPSSQLPSYVDDVVEYPSITDFPAIGEADKIYVALDTNFTYRWSGSDYVQINVKSSVEEYVDMSAFPQIGETAIIYVAKDTDKIYRWTGTGYVELSESVTYLPIPSTWTVNSTTAALAQSIIADASATAGMGYLGKLYCSDLPGGLVQGEAVIEIISDDNANGKNIHIILTSANQAPYRWEYSYVKINGSYSSPAGWVGYQPELISGTNIKTVANNSLLGSGNVTITKSDVGLANVDNTSDANKPISTATQTALDAKQGTLISGTNIKTINNASLLGSGNIETESTEGISISIVEFILQYGFYPDPELNNNSWTVIKTICEMGLASNFWSLGSVKTDIGTDGTTRAFRICDMQGLYNKHVVFEQLESESSSYIWNQQSNKDSDSCYNDYDIADIRTSMNTTIKALYSNDLQSVLTQTTVKVAKNGASSSILEVTDYLFLPAEKEILENTYQSHSEEAAVLTQYQWYNIHNTDADRIKKKNNSASKWRLRSPLNNSLSNVCSISYDGSESNDTAKYTSVGIAPCFAF